MNNTRTGMDHIEEDEIANYEVSDEALEAAAGTSGVTHVMCTVLPECSGQPAN